MDGAQTGSFAVLVAAMAIVAALVLLGVPCVARLIFRSRMEAIRDDGVDAILAGQLRHEPPVSAFLAALERVARRANWATIARNGAIVRALYDLEVEHPRDEFLAFDFRCLDSAERKIMSDLEWRVIDAHRSYMIWGSPLGWIFSMIVLVATRYGPESKLGKTQRTMPDVTRETMCADRGAYPETRRSRQSHAVQ